MNINRFRQLDFFGILGYPNPIDNEVTNVVPMFSRNYAISAEDHIMAFEIVMDNFDIRNEDVYIKIFMKSLIEDARDWFKNLSDATISSWNEFRRIFKDRYGDHLDPNFYYMK